MTAEEYVSRGEQLGGSGVDRARPFAEALARLVGLAPSPGAAGPLSPAPPWVGWEHAGAGVWPWPDDLDADLNAHPGPGWLDDLGRRVRERLLGTRLPAVVGHGDFESQNVWWRGGELLAVHDWDSVVALPEPAVAGAAAAVFTETGRAAERATVEESARFLECYVRARDVGWGREEWGWRGRPGCGCGRSTPRRPWWRAPDASCSTSSPPKRRPGCGSWIEPRQGRRMSARRAGTQWSP
ncbi:phosphotransferase [Nonomuraea rubra]|uniref:phosphotransferase n=1 Tax=Nonomuraea rubra TaxID=46180 RepID=UPI003622931A